MSEVRCPYCGSWHGEDRYVEHVQVLQKAVMALQRERDLLRGALDQADNTLSGIRRGSATERARIQHTLGWHDDSDEPCTVVCEGQPVANRGHAEGDA